MNDKKIAKRQYKDTYHAPGVFMIKNLTTGKVFIKGRVDVKSAINRYKFELMMGKSFYKKLQKDWKQYGADKFEFSILEEIEEHNEPYFDYENALDECEKKWQAKYSEDILDD